MRQLRELGARVRLFGDGDIANGIIAALEERSRIDMLMGIGGATEGVVAACAVKCLGGDMQARLWLRDGEDAVAQREGLDPNAMLGLDELCRSDLAMLAATGVTDGELLKASATCAAAPIHAVDHHLVADAHDAHGRWKARPAIVREPDVCTTASPARYVRIRSNDQPS